MTRAVAAREGSKSRRAAHSRNASCSLGRARSPVLRPNVDCPADPRGESALHHRRARTAIQPSRCPEWMTERHDDVASCMQSQVCPSGRPRRCVAPARSGVRTRASTERRHTNGKHRNGRRRCPDRALRPGLLWPGTNPRIARRSATAQSGACRHARFRRSRGGDARRLAARDVSTRGLVKTNAIRQPVRPSRRPGHLS